MENKILKGKKLLFKFFFNTQGDVDGVRRKRAAAAGEWRAFVRFIGYCLFFASDSLIMLESVAHVAVPYHELLILAAYYGSLFTFPSLKLVPILGSWGNEFFFLTFFFLKSHGK
jgi:hypothetical protein